MLLKTTLRNVLSSIECLGGRQVGEDGTIPMRLKEVIKVFAGLGWEAGSDDGDRYVIRDLGDRRVQMYIEFKRFDEEPKPLTATPFVSTPAFDDLVERIDGTPRHLIPLVGPIGWGDRETKIPQPINEEVIAGISEEVVDWARAQDLDAVLARLRALPTSSVGIQPLKHLAALADAGDVATLQSYAEAFASGDRLGFVPYITEDYIARALAIAEERAAVQLS